MDIVVIRGEGDAAGDDIVEALLSDVNAGLSRGQAELDQGALADEQTLSIVPQDLRLGQRIAVEDSALGHWQGKLTGLVHTVSIDDDGNLLAETRITLRKPRQ